MSLNGAMSNALGGLSVASRSAALVSSNISNALTEGYGRRSLSVSASTLSQFGGVEVNGVQRQSNPLLTADRRIADAGAEGASTLLSQTAELERLFGDALTGDTLRASLAQFENALITAAGDPSSDSRLLNLAHAGQEVATKLNSLSEGIQQVRKRADDSIAQNVKALNSGLASIDALNTQIIAASMSRQDTSALVDQRQAQIDQISGIVPLQVVARDRGDVAIFTTEGAVLLDGRPATIEFSPVNAMVAGSTLDSGELSGLTINDQPYRTGVDGPFFGGSLGAFFQMRDEIAPGLQADLDAVAVELAQRLGADGPDASLGINDPGVYTDGGNVLDLSDEVGFAGRIELNPLLAPEAVSHAAWRDGLGAAGSGAVGDASLLNSLHQAVVSLAEPSSGNLAAGQYRLADLAESLHSKVATYRVGAETDQSLTETRRTALVQLEMSQGVDTDAELQNLLLIEQSYAANARVITVVDEMLQRLLAI